MSAPLVSVVLPVYDGEKYLAEAIQSVLDQTYPHVELRVVDDGSRDGSAAVARGFGNALELLSQANRGLAAARNRGLDGARGTLLAFLDADDLWTPDKLALQVAALHADPGREVIYCYAEQFFSPDAGDEIRATVRIPTEPVPVRTSVGMLLSSETFARVGAFRDLPIGTDMDWHMRAVEAGLAMHVLPDVLYRRRIHKSNEGIRSRASANVRLKILKQALDRRRARQDD